MGVFLAGVVVAGDAGGDGGRRWGFGWVSPTQERKKKKKKKKKGKKEKEKEKEKGKKRKRKRKRESVMGEELMRG